MQRTIRTGFHQCVFFFGFPVEPAGALRPGRGRDARVALLGGEVVSVLAIENFLHRRSQLRQRVLAGPEQVPGTMIKDKWKKGEILDLEQTAADVSMPMTACCREAASNVPLPWVTGESRVDANQSRSLGRELLEQTALACSRPAFRIDPSSEGNSR